MQAISFLTFYWGSDSSRSVRDNFPTHWPVSASFFETVGIAIRRGRVFEDRTGAPREVVVNEAMAKLLWPASEPLGQCLRFEARTNPCYTVVGIAENSRRGYVIEDADKPQYFLPLSNLPMAGYAGVTLLVRTRPEAMTAAITEMSGALERAFPLAQASVKTMQAVLEPEYRPWRLGATLFTAFGFLALLVAVIGIYSTVSYAVTQRTHEFGIRAALGAQLGDVVRQVVGEGVRVVALGIVVGIALALASGKLIAALLYGVEPYDPWTMLFVAAVLVVVAAAAAVFPAWRAGRVDPVTALRAE